VGDKRLAVTGAGIIMIFLRFGMFVIVDWWAAED
jgi:hypothetical protein